MRNDDSIQCVTVRLMRGSEIRFYPDWETCEFFRPQGDSCSMTLQQFSALLNAEIEKRKQESMKP